MFKWLVNLFASRTAIGQGRDNPALRAAVLRSAEIFDALPGKDAISESSRHQLARQLYLDLHEIFNASSPVDANRQKLAAQVLRYAMFQVLLLPPPPKPDETGLRGLPGISGELQKRLKDIVRANSELHAALFADADSFDDDNDDKIIMQRLERKHQECRWCLETLNSARVALDDVAGSGDWYRAFLFAACANQENTYRFDIGLPLAFETDVSAPVAYSLFTDIVLAGAKDPLAEWTEYHRGSNVPMPRMSDSPQ